MSGSPTFSKDYTKSITDLYDFWNSIINKKKIQEKMYSDPSDFFSSFQSKSPLSIFSPDIMKKTMSRVAMDLQKQILTDPKTFETIQKSYTTNMEEIWTGVMDGMSSGNFSSIINETSKDKRFKDEEWQSNPIFNYFKQVYLLNAKFLKDSLSKVNMDDDTKKKMDFYVQHLIDALSPSNFPLTNPQVIRETVESNGQNLFKGYQKLLEDMKSGNISMSDTSTFKVGENLAITPGEVVYQNDLFQLIQYHPTTETVCKRPMLVVPPWINKYYIFDLQEKNSFIKWMLDQGVTVFLMSWVNPDKRHMNKTMDDYVLSGIYEAVKQVKAITEEKDINLLGYCAGGIFSMMFMSYLEKIKDDSVYSISLFAAPVDSEKIGSMGVFVCEDQLTQLESYMKDKGYLEGQALMNSFNLLRANDLIWSYYINNYLMGKDVFPFDMLYWNADPVRMPAKLYINYLREIFLNNCLMKKNSIKIDGKGVDLSVISKPVFAMGTIDDHISPWQSVYPIINKVKSEDKKFILASSGHVAGVMNHPNKGKYNYWSSSDNCENTDEWFEKSERQEGSWWGEWMSWVKDRGGKVIKSRKVNMKFSIEKAPGSFVKAK
jgi:polyhydroxyalkanoate synthase